MHQPNDPLTKPNIKVKLTDKATPGDRFILAIIWLSLRDRPSDPDNTKRIPIDDWFGDIQDLDCLPPEIKEDVKLLGVQETLGLSETPTGALWHIENGEIVMPLEGQIMGLMSATSLKFV